MSLSDIPEEVIQRSELILVHYMSVERQFFDVRVPLEILRWLKETKGMSGQVKARDQLHRPVRQRDLGRSFKELGITEMWITDV